MLTSIIPIISRNVIDNFMRIGNSKETIDAFLLLFEAHCFCARTIDFLDQKRRCKRCPVIPKSIQKEYNNNCGNKSSEIARVNP